jgi:hypothetical protein
LQLFPSFAAANLTRIMTQRCVNKPNKNKLHKFAERTNPRWDEEFLLWFGNQQQTPTASAEAMMRIKWI